MTQSSSTGQLRLMVRMLLSNTSGHEYDWMNPLLLKWRASRDEPPWHGTTVEEKSTLPLVFEPGTSFRYGAGSDWTGKLIETATGLSLDSFMQKKIWDPLGIKDITFWPKKRPDMQNRLAKISTLNEKGEPPAVDAEGYDFLAGVTDCLGGGGAFASAKDYFVFLQAVLRRDLRILNEASWQELFRPQLDERCKKEFNDYINSSPLLTQALAMRVPAEVERSWSFAGMVCEMGQPGRMGRGTVMWGGVPSEQWVSIFHSYFRS